MTHLRKRSSFWTCVAVPALRCVFCRPICSMGSDDKICRGYLCISSSALTCYRILVQVATCSDKHSDSCEVFLFVNYLQATMFKYPISPFTSLQDWTHHHEVSSLGFVHHWLLSSAKVYCGLFSRLDFNLYAEIIVNKKGILRWV